MPPTLFVVPSSSAARRAEVALLFQPGGFLTAAIHLENGVNLHIAKDATLAFVQNPSRYLPAVFTGSRNGVDELLTVHHAFDRRNIGVTG